MADYASREEFVKNQARPWNVLAERNFGLFWSSLLVSSIGSQLTSVAIAWQIYEITNSPLQLGLTGLFRALPVIAFALNGGWLADRVERRWLLAVAQGLSLFLSLSLGLLTDSGHIRVWQIYGIIFAASVLNSFDLPARNALIPKPGNPPIPSLQCLLVGNSSLLASGSIETRPLKDKRAQTVDAAYPQLRREFLRLGVNLRSGTGRFPAVILLDSR